MTATKDSRWIRQLYYSPLLEFAPRLHKKKLPLFLKYTKALKYFAKVKENHI